MYQINDYSAMGRVVQTKKYYKNVLKKSPSDHGSLHMLGRIAINEGHVEKGLKMIKQALAYAPLNAKYHEALATALYKRGNLSSAATECLLALRLHEKLHEPLNILGLIARDQGNYEEAIDYFSRAIEKHVPYMDAMNNLATVLIRKGDYDTAEKYLRLILDLDQNHFRAWNNLGLALRGKGMHSGAKQAFTKADKYPPSQFNLGHNFLLEGNIGKGLALYEQRKNLLGIGKGIHQPEWNGKPHKQKTILVIHEQGFGDTIMMSRFLPVLTNYFKNVVVKVQKPLLELMNTIDPRLTIVTDIEKQSFDFWCPVMSLPYRLKIDRKDKIPTAPWFKFPKYKKDKKILSVGLNWAGNPSYMYDAVRSTHLKNFDMLLKVKEVDWISLHKGHLEAEASKYNLQQPLLKAKNFYETAQCINNLDLVISTETAVPNLSAALGISTCVLTSPDYDWRWKNWYQNVHICNQDIQGNWYGSIYKALEVINKMIYLKNLHT